MKYFTHELWSKINSSSQEESDEANLQWEKNMNEYSVVFEAIKTKFSQKFLKAFYKAQWFHDFRIISISLKHREYGVKNPISIEIILTNDINTYKITYLFVKKYIVNFEEDKELE